MGASYGVVSLLPLCLLAIGVAGGFLPLPCEAHLPRGV